MLFFLTVNLPAPTVLNMHYRVYISEAQSFKEKYRKSSAVWFPLHTILSVDKHSRKIQELCADIGCLLNLGTAATDGITQFNYHVELNAAATWPTIVGSAITFTVMAQSADCACSCEAELQGVFIFGKRFL